jgi:membrane protein
VQVPRIRGAEMQSRVTNNRMLAVRWGIFEVPSRHLVWALVKHVWADLLADDCLDLAAQMSFYFVLSLFPFLLVIAAILGWLPSSNLWHNFVQWVTEYLPRETRSMVFATVFDLSRGYTKFFSLGLLAVLWTASSGFVSLMESLSAAYGVKETRSFWEKRVVAVCATVIAAAFAVASFGLLAFGHRIGEAVSYRIGLVSFPWEIVRWMATLALMLLGLEMISYFLPNRHRRWRWMTVGNAFVALTYIGISATFNFYLRHFNSYPRTYGTLAGFIILMTWVYISNLILLAGAEMDHAIEHLGEGRNSS